MKMSGFKNVSGSIWCSALLLHDSQQNWKALRLVHRASSHGGTQAEGGEPAAARGQTDRCHFPAGKSFEYVSIKHP